MAKNKASFLCGECGDTFPKWFGKCPSCGAFNSIKEFREAKVSGEKKLEGVDLVSEQTPSSSPLSGGGQEFTGSVERLVTGISELDRVTGGGFFPGSITLFGGHPGIGKSTLSLQIFLALSRGSRPFDSAQGPGKVFYFSGEESREQVMNRAERLLNPLDPPCQGDFLGKISDNIFSTNNLSDIVETVEKQRPDFVVVDSIQMVGVPGQSFGTMSQVRENAEILLKLAKSTRTTMLVIGHVTKADEIAGPKVLEHLVDAVLYLEGERNSEVRILRSPKNRFGSTLELGVFEMESSGLRVLENPSENFLEERAENASGSVVTVVREGVRNFLLETQILTTATNFGNPRRTANGVTLNRFHMLLAVVSKFTPFKCDEMDAYLNIVGGFRVQDPSVDLAVVAGILSSRTEKEIPADTVIFGEVGLSGEVRRCANMDARIGEAAKLGFKKVFCPRLPKSVKAPEGISLVEVRDVKGLLRELWKPSP